MPKCLCALFAALALCCLPIPLVADDGAEELAPKVPADRLQIHGFLTQAYAWVDEGFYLGIPDGGTTDYRTAALQVRYDASNSSSFVFQIDHERLGDSPFDPLFDEVELDWIFYQHRFASGTAVQVGRVPRPTGIYNEIRDVGTLLPFYRPPAALYFEGLFSTDTLDGISVRHLFAADGSWPIELTAYYGGWEALEIQLSGTPRTSKAEDALGGQVWVGTPIAGLRFGASFVTFDTRPSPSTAAGSFDSWLLSLDGDFARWSVRAELLEAEFSLGDYTASYVQLGYRFNETFSLFGQWEEADVSTVLPFVGPVEVETADEWAASLNVHLRHDLLLKLEYHEFEGFNPEGIGTPEGLFYQQTGYGIVSVAYSF